MAKRLLLRFASSESIERSNSALTHAHWARKLSPHISGENDVCTTHLWRLDCFIFSGDEAGGGVAGGLSG